MAKFLIGVSGAQGAGKTTMLNEIAARGYHVDGFKVSRVVQEQLGWSDLSQVLTSAETMMDFQERVLEEKWRHDYALAQFRSETVILTERTFADVAAYTTSWAWQLVDGGQLELGRAFAFLQPFVDRCVKAQLECYDAVVLLPFMADTVVFENDRRRAPRETIDSVYEDIESFLKKRALITKPALTITEKTVEARATQVIDFIRSIANGRQS